MTFKSFLEEKEKKNKNCKYLELDEYIWDQNFNEHDFEKLFFNFNKPTIIRGFCKNTIAFNTWNENSIIDVFNDIKLPCEQYNSDSDFYNGEGKLNFKKKIKMKNVLEYIKSDKKPYLYLAEVDIKKLKGNTDNIIFDLFNPNIIESVFKNQLVNTLYLGNNAASGCHIHIEDNFLLNQVFGTKTIYFFDYHDNDGSLINNWLLTNIIGDQYIVPSMPFDDEANFIKNKFFEMNHSKMKIYKATLNPGDSILIPPWWWHATRGNDLNLSFTTIYNRRDISYLFFRPLLIFLYIAKFFEEYEYYELLIYFSAVIILFYIINKFISSNFLYL